MPTFERLPRFDRDWAELDPREQARFRAAASAFLDDLRAGTPAVAGHVQVIRGAPGVFALSWSAEGHATLSSRAAETGGIHLTWRRIAAQPAARRR